MVGYVLSWLYSVIDAVRLQCLKSMSIPRGGRSTWRMRLQYDKVWGAIFIPSVVTMTDMASLRSNSPSSLIVRALDRLLSQKDAQM